MEAADGRWYALTTTGTRTLDRMGLNRPEAVAYRLKQREYAESLPLIAGRREILDLIDRLRRREEFLLDQQLHAAAEARMLTRLLLGDRTETTQPAEPLPPEDTP